MPRAEAIITRAREYIGTPYHHQARAPGVGLDCIGFIVCILQSLGYEVRDRKTYPMAFRPHEFVAIVADHLHSKPIESMCPSDLLLIRPGSFILHSAIYLGNDSVIHCGKPNGVEERGMHDWRVCIAHCFDMQNPK